MTPVFDSYIKTAIRPDVDDLGCCTQNAMTRTANLRIEFTEDEVICHGLALYPMPVARWRVVSLEAGLL